MQSIGRLRESRVSNGLGLMANSCEQGDSAKPYSHNLGAADIRCLPLAQYVLDNLHLSPTVSHRHAGARVPQRQLCSSEISLIDQIAGLGPPPVVPG